MGMERNDHFNEAADRLYGATNGSPIGAAAMEITKDGIPVNGDMRVNVSLEAPVIGNSDSEQSAQSPAEPFIAMLMRKWAEAERNRSDNVELAEADAIEADAHDSMTDAQTLDAMSAGAEAFADDLELEGSDEVAGYLREAAKQVRKAARAARREAREILMVADAVLDENA